MIREPSIECPCCGDVAAVGEVTDGDPLLCGCVGWISMDAETDPVAIVDECEEHYP